MPPNRFPVRAAGRLSAVVGVLALAGSLAVPAGAQAAGDTYAAASRADGVLVRIEGQQVSIASATANADSSPAASATGAGFFTPQHTEGATSAEVVEDGQQDGSEEPVCSDLEAPPEMPVLDAFGACSTSQAAIQGGLPSATSTATGSVISVGVEDLPIGDVPLGDAVDEVINGLGPLFGGLEDAGIDAETLVNELLEAILEGDVAAIEMGNAAATVAETEGGQVTATGSIEGAVIGLFDRGELLGGPIVTITLGAATASVTRDRSTGESVPSFTPAPVTIEIAGDIPLPEGFPNPIELPPGQSQCIPLPPPLESCITAGGGTTEATDDEVTAKAASMRIDLLTGLPEGGITVALSNAEAGIAATVPATPTSSSTSQVTAAPPTAPPTLPRTGGPGPWLPAAGWALLGLAVLTGGAARLATGRRAA
jgi:hypothetical protein